MKLQTGPQKPRSRNADERGSALILTLGMLMLITVLFISFTIVAIYNQQNIKITENIIKARLQAQTSLQRVYALLAAEWGDPSDPQNLYPASKGPQTGFIDDASGSWANRNYWVSTGADTQGLDEALHVVYGGVDFTPSSTASLDSSGDIGWVHIPDPGGSGEIIGRVAYIVVDESGKIDPTAATGATAEGSETRTGIDPSDINLQAVFDADDKAEALQRYGVGNGKMPAGTRWFSYYHMLKTASSLADSTTNPGEILQDTVFPYSADIEAMAQNGDYHRFYLARPASYWDSYNNDIATAVTPAIDAAASLFWNADGTIAGNTGGIPWIHNCAEATLKNQIMANLIDYGDADSIPTTDLDTTAGTLTYMGAEKTPLINEIHFEQLHYYSSGYRLRLRIRAELLNMYDTALAAGGQLQIKWTYSCNIGSAADITTTFNLPAIGAQRYYHVGTESRYYYLGTSSLSNTKMTIHWAKLTDKDGNIIDYAFKDYESPTSNLSRYSTIAIACETNDPRCDFANEDWTWSPSWSSLGAGTLDNGTGATGKNTTVCTYNDGTANTDAEGVTTQPWQASTMYISNNGISTMWELGAIHRGEPWQTINLHTFNSAADETTGLGVYADGDANILEQLKLTQSNRVYGKININTHSAKVLKGLLTNIRIGATYAAPGTGADGISESEAGKIAYEEDSGVPKIECWLYQNGAATSEPPFANRGRLADIAHLQNSTAGTQNTDAAKEEIICKIAQLCTTRTNFYTVIVVSQIIKDFAPIGSLDFENTRDRIEAEQKLMAVIQRDAHTNNFTIIRTDYLDE